MHTLPSNLVNVTDYGITGINFYWTRKERFGVSEKEMNEVGIYDGNAYVDKSIIEPLQKAQHLFKEAGYELIVKDAYRTPELYHLVQKKRYEVRGKEETDALLNMVTMPHTTGRAIDINLIDPKTGQELLMRDPAEDPGAFFIDFYRERQDPQSQEYQHLQDLMVTTMLSVGFRLGSKKEFWHFEYPASTISEVSFSCGEEQLAASIVSPNAKKPTILFLHGAGSSNRKRAIPIAEKLAEQGHASLLFDFSGHGDSTGELSRSSLEKRVREAESAFPYLDSGIPQAVIGSSMGGHIALELVRRHTDIKTLILFCPAVYTSRAFALPFDDTFTKAIREPESWRTSEVFAGLEHFSGKLLIVISAHDDVIPADVPQALMDAAKSASKKELLILPDIDHKLIVAITENSDLLEEISQKVGKFLLLT
jgi:pimeloyl-ACP methyl ester carboxylesterase/D-alanyl-D-alanine dipeptidase